MFKGLMRRSSSSSTPDGRSQSGSNGKKSSGIWRKKTDSKSKAAPRGDDRERSLGDLSADPAPSSSDRRSYEPSVASESVAEVDRDARGARRRDRERSSSPEAAPRGLNGNLSRSRHDSANEESNPWRGPQRWPPGDVSLPPLDTGAAHTTSDQFAADIASDGFSQFPMQYDNNHNYDSPNYNNPVSIPPLLMPGQSDPSPTSPAPFDPHVPQQFPGQFPTHTAEPYRPYNPAGEAADYYGDQGQSVQDQPGVRPNPPLVIPNSQAHLMPASPVVNPPPEPSSMGQLGSAAEFYAESPDVDNPVPQQQPPPEPSKPSKPNKPSAAPAGIPSGPPSHDTPGSSVPPEEPGLAGIQPVGHTQNSPTQSHSMGPTIGAALGAAAVGYMANHHHNSSATSSEHPSPSSYTQNHEPHSPIGQPGPAIYPNPALNNPNYASNPSHPDHQAVYHSSPFQSGGLAFQQRQRGALDKFMDFWKDHEGVGMYEDYTEAIGVCKYCFEPGTTSKDAPRKHNYRPRRRSSDRFSNDSRVNKSSRYSSPSDDESRRRGSSSKKSWFGGLLSGYAVKSLFESPDFEDSYNVRPSRVSSPRSSFSSDSESDSDHKSKPSHRRRRSSLSQSPGGGRRNSYSDPRRSRYEGPRLRSRSRSGSNSRSGSSSRSNSALRDFALGAAVGSVASAATSRSQKKRSRSPKRKGKGRKESTTEESSSSSYLDISRPTTAGSLGSFFNTPSENKKKPRPKSRKGFFPFSNNNSSSSSLDDDLAFGSAYTKKPKKPKKGKGKKKDEDVNAKLLELGALATVLAGSTRGRRSGEILAGRASRRPQSAPSAPEDDEWQDCSEGQESSVSSALAFGGSSSSEDSSDSGTSKWNWGWGSKKDKKKNEQRRDSPSHSEFPTGSILAGAALGTAALASGYRKEGEHFSSPSSSSSESLQHLDPVPASDPPQFNTGSFPQSPPVKEPAFIPTGPIPLQQPQPVTPVSQAVYSSQGEPVPVYNAPTVPPFFPPDAFYDPGSGRQVYPQRSDVSTNWNRTHRRRESSPDFYPGPFQDFTTPSYKRRPADQASVQFDLTEEQEDKERRAARRGRERRDSDRDQGIQIRDHESEEENRKPRRLERLELEPERGRSRSRSRSSTRRDRSPDRRRRGNDDSSSWVGPAAAGAIGAATAAAAMSSRAPSESASESSQRHKERSAKRRADRRLPSSEVGWGQSSVEPARADIDERPQPRPEPARVEPKEEPRTQPEPADVDIEDESQIATEDQPRHDRNSASRVPSTKSTHESYATFFSPEGIGHSPDAQTGRRDKASISTIPRDEPESPSQQDIEPPSQYLQGHPWSIPRLNLIEPTPPHSQNGSVRDIASPDPAAAEPSHKEEAEARRHEQGSTTGSRVTWGGNETREYEVPETSSEQDSVDYEIAHEHEPDDMQKDSIDHGTARDMQRGSIQQEIEFAAILNATTKDAGFDPAILPADTYYDTRSSSPQAEHHEFSEPEPSLQKHEPHGAGQDEAQTPPREERKPEAMDAPEVKRHRDAIERFNASKAKEIMPGSFDEEPVQPTEDPSRPVAEGKRPKDNDRPPRRRSNRDSARDDPRKTAIDVSRPEPIREEPQSEKKQGPVNNDVPSKEEQNVNVPGEFAPTVLAAFPPQPIGEQPRGKGEREPVRNESPWEDYHQSETPGETERSVSPPSPSSGYRMSQDDLNKSELVLGEIPRETERPVSPPSPGSGYRMSQDDLNKSELVPGEIPRTPSPSGYRLSQDDLSKSELVVGEIPRAPSPTGYHLSQDDLSKSELVVGEIPRAPSPTGYHLSQDDLSKSELVVGEIPRAPSPTGYRLSQDDLSRSEFVLEDNRKPVPSREREAAPAVSRLPLRRGRRSQDKLHSKNDNVASSEKGPKDAVCAVSVPESARQERRSQDQSHRTNDSLPAGPNPKEANEDHPKPAWASKSDNPDSRERGQFTSQQQQQRSQRSETTTRQGPKEPSPAVTSREQPSEEYKGKDERDVAPDEGRKARGPKDTSPAPRPLIWNEPRSEDGPAPVVTGDAALENKPQPRTFEETLSDELVLAPDGEDRRRRDEPDSNDDNVPENGQGNRDEEDINVQRYRFSRQQREERRRREEERRRQEAEGIASPNGREEEYEKARKDAEEHEPARSLESPVKIDDTKDNTEDSRLPFPLSVPDSRLRSRSISPPGSAKAIFDVGPKSRSRPTSPELNQQRQSLQANDGDRSRRLSMLDSPTAIPLQFRRPPSTSPTGRRSPSVGSPEPPVMSLSSPPERRARRRSMEFVNSREIMPLFLVEQNGQHQHHTEEQLPSLPSSKSSSRNTSPVEDLRAAPYEKGLEVVEPTQDGQIEEQSQSEPCTVIPSQEPALSQEEQPKADISIPAQVSAELEKEAEKEISRDAEAQEPIDEPFPPLPSSHGSLNASVENLSAVPDTQGWKVLDLTHDVHSKKLELGLTTPQERTGEEKMEKKEQAEKESEKMEVHEPIDGPLPALPSSHGSLNASVEDLGTVPNEQTRDTVNFTEDIHPKEVKSSSSTPSRERIGEEYQKGKDESERDIQKVEVQAPIDEQFPPLPSSHGSLNASVEDLSAVPDDQSQNPVDLSRDVQPEPSVSTPALQSEDEHQPGPSITIPSQEHFGGDEAEKGFSEKAETQEPIDEQLPPLPSSKGSSLNASVEHLAPSEEDWNQVDLTQGVQEEQPEFGLPFQETVGDDGVNEKEMANVPEPINEQLPPLPSSNDSSLNASVEDLGVLSSEDSWNMMNQPDGQLKPVFSTTFPSQEPILDRDSQPEEKPELELSVTSLNEPALNQDAQFEGQPESGFSITVPSQEPALHETQPEDHHQPDLLPSEEPAFNHPEDKPKPELTIKFPSQEPLLNEESQPQEQFTPHSLEPILEEAEDEIQPDTSTTISSQPDLNRDIHLNDAFQSDPSNMIPQRSSEDGNPEKAKEIEKALPDSQQEPLVKGTTYRDSISPEAREKDTSDWEVVETIQNALPEQQVEPEFPKTAPSRQPPLSQDVQPDQPRDLSVAPPQEAAGEEEPEGKGKEKAMTSSDAQQEEPTEARVKKDSPPPYDKHQEDEVVNPTQDVQIEPQRKPSLSVAIPSQEPEDELEEKYAKAREKDIDFHEFDTIDEEWTASEIMREREKHKHEFDIHSPAELLWDPHKYFIMPRSFGGMGSRSFGGSLAPRPYEPPKIQDDDIDISDADEDIFPPESGPSDLPEKESSAPEPTDMTAPTQKEKFENLKDFAGVDAGEEQPIPETRSPQIREDKAVVPDIEVTPPVKNKIVPTVPVTIPKEEQAPSTPGFGGVVAAVAAAVDTRESQPDPEAQTDVKEDKPVVPDIEVTPAAKDETASDIAPTPASKEEQTRSNFPTESAAIVDAALAAATGSTNDKPVPEEGVARDLREGDLSPPAEQSTAFLDGSQQSDDGQEPYRTLSPIIEEPDLESERSQSVDLAHDEHTDPQESEKTESEVPAAEDMPVSRAPIGEQLPVPEMESTAIASETERVLGATAENEHNTVEVSQEAQPSDEAQSVTTETATSRDGYAESTQDSGTDFWDAVEKHDGEGSIASSLERPIDVSGPPTPREWRTETSFEPEVPAQDVQVSPVEEFSRSTPVEEERQDAGTPKPGNQLVERIGSTQAPIEAQNTNSQSDIARDEPQGEIEPTVADSEQLLGEFPEQTGQPIANEPKSLVKSALEVTPEVAADIETPANATEKFPQARSKEEYEKDRFVSSLESVTETEAEHSQSADAAAGAGTFETSGEVPATDARRQSPEPAGAQDVEPVPVASENVPITPVEKSESNIAAPGPLSLEAKQTPASAPLLEPGTTQEDKQDVEGSGEESKHGSPSTTLDEAASIELPSSPHAEVADVNIPAVTSHTLPSSVTPAEEPSQEQLIEREMPHFIAENESVADADAPLTPAQKKKAKKERRKKRRSTSLDESVPAIPQDETTSIDDITPVKAPSVEKDSDIAHEPTEDIAEQPRDDVPPADMERTEAPETSVEQEPPQSDAPSQPETTSVQEPVVEVEPTQEKAQDDIAPTVRTPGTTGEPIVTESKPAEKERDITASVEPVSTNPDHVEEAPKEDPVVGTNVTAPAQDPTATELSPTKDVPQDDPVHAQDQPPNAATTFQELSSLEKANEEAPGTEPPSRTNSKKNKKKHRRSASSEVEQPAPAENVTDAPSIEIPAAPAASEEATKEKAVESPVTETQEHLGPIMSKKQAKKERKKRRSMIFSMGQSPDEPPVESAQPNAVHETPVQELQQQQPDNNSAVKSSQTIPDSASAEGFKIVDAPADTPIESVTPDFQGQVKVEEPREAPAQKSDEAIAQEAPQVNEKEELKSDLETQLDHPQSQSEARFEPKEAGLLTPTSEPTLHPEQTDAEDLPGNAKKKARNHRRRRSRILEQLAEAEAERERERAQQALSEGNPTGILPVTESKPTAPAADSDLWTDPSISSQIEQGREVPFASPSSEQVDDNQLVPALNEEPRAESSPDEPEAIAGPIEMNKGMETQAGYDSQVQPEEQRTQVSAFTPADEERELVPETAPTTEEKTKESRLTSRETAELPSIQTEKSESLLGIVGPIPANEPAATVDLGEVSEKPASDVVPSEQSSSIQEESCNPQETVLAHDSPTAEPREESAPATPSRKRSRKEKKRARKRTKEKHESPTSPEGILSESTTAFIEQPPLVSEQVEDTKLPQGDEQVEDPKVKVEDSETAGEKALQELVEQPHRREPIEPVEGQHTAQPLEDEQPLTLEKSKEVQEGQSGKFGEEQVTMQEPRSNDNVEAVNESHAGKASDSASESSTSRRFKGVASIFPNLKRGTFRLPSKNQSVKDRAEDETTEPEVSRGFENEDVTRVSEAPITSQEGQRERLSSAEPFEDEPSFQLSTTTNPETTITDVAIDVEVDEYYKVSILSDGTTGESPAIEIDPISGGSAKSAEQSPDNEWSAHGPPSSDEQSSTVVDSSPTAVDTSREVSPSGRSPTKTPSPSRSLAPSPPLPEPRNRVEITDGARTTDRNGKPRLEIKPVESLRPRTPRSTSPIRKYMGNAWARQATKKHGEYEVIRPPVRQNSLPVARRPQTPERKPILRPSSMSNFHGAPNMQQAPHSPDVPRSLRRKSKTTRDMSGDLRAASRALQEENGPQPPPTDINIERIASSSSYDPVTDKGKRPIRGMTDVYEAWGETPSSPRSPSRPPSVRHRRSMQHLQQLEFRLDQLISENRLLTVERDAAEDKLKKTTVARRKSDQALNSQNTDLRDRAEEVEELKKSVEWFQKEVNRLTEENEELTGEKVNLAAAHERELQEFQEFSAREIEELRTQCRQAITDTQDRIRWEVDEKNADLRRLREELQREREEVQKLQHKIASGLDNVLVLRDDEFFRAACHNLYVHVRHWVKRFSKHSDDLKYLKFDQLQEQKARKERLEEDPIMAARLDVDKLDRLDVDKLIDRFDNTILDGSDVESYLKDRVGRRDVFMSVTMTMMWKFIFAPYMFGIDSEKQQKLNSLEEQLAEAGKLTAVHRWRATTLSLLSKSPSFAKQREIEIEAIMHEIYDTLGSICPPPKEKKEELHDSLRTVLQLAVTLSIEMRTQLDEYYMVRPLLAEFGANGVVTRRVHFNKALMNEHSAPDSGAGEGSVRLFLFPLVVKEHDDREEDKGPVVIYPAQVLVNRPAEFFVGRSSKSLDRKSSVNSSVPSLGA